MDEYVTKPVLKLWLKNVSEPQIIRSDVDFEKSRRLRIWIYTVKVFVRVFDTFSVEKHRWFGSKWIFFVINCSCIVPVHRTGGFIGVIVFEMKMQVIERNKQVFRFDVSEKMAEEIALLPNGMILWIASWKEYDFHRFFSCDPLIFRSYNAKIIEYDVNLIDPLFNMILV